MTIKSSQKTKVIFSIMLTFVILICYGLIYWNYNKLQTENLKSSIDSSPKTMLMPVGKRAEIAITPPVKMTPTAPVITKKIFNIPALIYHKTPDNFEEQLIVLRDRGYTTITMSELNDIIRGRTTGPAKPVAITFDDGFSDQLRAFDLLKKYNMKATFYIITGGDLSNWCIGADRKDYSCGDSYMSWQDIINLKNSGLIEIGSHTLNHLSLPNQTLAIQRDEIIRSKKIIEDKLDITITSFAYPYGKLNDSIIGIVKEAGYTNATGTAENSIMSLDLIYNLPRLRSTLKFP
jgi:peptidoglycan/xylan/chitin deacetylase (PgdA/CDA1 family)